MYLRADLMVKEGMFTRQGELLSHQLVLSADTGLGTFSQVRHTVNGRGAPHAHFYPSPTPIPTQLPPCMTVAN